MPDTATESQQQQQEEQNGTAPQTDGKTQVHPVEFPEVPEGTSAACTGQLDILLDMDVPVTAVLGETQIPVRRLLQLGPGSVLTLEKPIEAPADLFLKGSKFAEADVVVVDNRFAVRIRQIFGAGAPANPTQE